METIFLSYTYNPHPDYKDETEELVKNIKIIAESQDLRVDTGVDLGGGNLTPEIKQRIDACDALVALVTPWDDNSDKPAIPQFVNDEYNYAAFSDKCCIRMLHMSLDNQGMNANQEFIPFEPKKQADALIKLMRTLALWKKKLGHSYEVQLLPVELVDSLNNAGEGFCKYQILFNHKVSEWKDIDVWPEPGGMVAYIPNVPDGAKINLKVTMGDEEWHSNFCNLLNNSIKLEKL